MTADRPAAHLWAAADRERRLIRSVQEAEWRRRMLRAGHIDPDQLSNQARRILAWLAEWDDWTVDGVAELLAAAHRSGLDAAEPVPASGTRPPAATAAHEPAVPMIGQRASSPGHVPAAEDDELSVPADAQDRRLESPPAGGGSTTTPAGCAQPHPTPGGHDQIDARLAALQQRRPESPVVGL